MVWVKGEGEVVLYQGRENASPTLRTPFYILYSTFFLLLYYRRHTIWAVPVLHTITRPVRARTLVNPEYQQGEHPQRSFTSYVPHFVPLFMTAMHKILSAFAWIPALTTPYAASAEDWRPQFIHQYASYST